MIVPDGCFMMRLLEIESFDMRHTPPFDMPTSYRLPVRLLKQLGALFLSFLLVLVLLWAFRQPLLHGFAEVWAVDQPLEKADVLLVLGGGLDVRPFAAAELYQQGYSTQVLVAMPPVKRTERLGLVRNHGEHNREVLLREGVPASAIVSLGSELKNTYQEALALREWLKSSPAKRIIIPTEAIHTRRVAWLFGKVLADMDVQLMVTRLESPDYNSTDWWMSELGFIAVQNEVLKYIYYRLKY